MSDESGEDLAVSSDPNVIAAEIADAIDEVLFEHGLECKHDGWTDEMIETLREFIHTHYDDLGESGSEYDPNAPESEDEPIESPTNKKRSRK